MPALQLPNFATVALILSLGLAASCSGNGPANVEDLSAGAESAYQDALSAFKEYDTQAAIVASRNDLQRDALGQERMSYQTLLNMCYEWTYRHNNFPPGELTRHAEQLVQHVEAERDKSLPMTSGEGEAVREYADSRLEFLRSLERLGIQLKELARNRAQQ